MEEVNHPNTTSRNATGTLVYSSANSFPSKIYTMLEDGEARGFDDIVAWQQGGKSFKIHQTEAFVSTIMQIYFGQGKFKSFQRQLNSYGWKKVQVGPNKGGFFHSSFIRGKPDLFKHITRRRDPRKQENRAGSLVVASLNKKHQRSSSSLLFGTAFVVAAAADPIMSTTSTSTQLDTRSIRTVMEEEENKRRNRHTRDQSVDIEALIIEAKKHHQHKRDQSLDLYDSEIGTFYDFFYPQIPLEKSNIHSTLLSMNHGDEDGGEQESKTEHDQERRRCDMMRLNDGDLADFVTMLESDIMQQQEEHMIEEQHHHQQQYYEEYYLQQGEMAAQEVLQQQHHHESSGAPPSSSSSTTTAASTSRTYNKNNIKNVVHDEDFESIEMSFPFKLYLMLENAERDNYIHIVSWVHDGKAFKVHNHNEFVSRVMPIYFDQSKYESFRRQLNFYHFSRCGRGEDRGVIYHPYLRKGARYLCNGIKRTTGVFHGNANNNKLAPLPTSTASTSTPGEKEQQTYY